jgi:thiol-disulfide isomerase/thioredoxin
MSAKRAVVAVALLIAVAVAAALFIGQGGGSDGGNGAAAARPAPTFTLPELREDRGQVALTAAPAKPTVVNFFAAWCEPCKRELPALQSAAAAHPDVAFLGVDHQDSRLDAIELLDAYGVTYPAGYDPRGDIAAKYAVRGLPATAFIDTDGRIVDFHQGELSAAELQQRLDRLTLRKPAS